MDAEIFEALLHHSVLRHLNLTLLRLLARTQRAIARKVSQFNRLLIRLIRDRRRVDGRAAALRPVECALKNVTVAAVGALLFRLCSRAIPRADPS